RLPAPAVRRGRRLTAAVTDGAAGGGSPPAVPVCAPPASLAAASRAGGRPCQALRHGPRRRPRRRPGTPVSATRPLRPEQLDLRRAPPAGRVLGRRDHEPRVRPDQHVTPPRPELK